MLRVRMASGKEVVAMQMAEFTQRTELEDYPIRGLKRQLQGLCEHTRFQQQLLLEDGTLLTDDARLEGPAELQLLVLPLCSSPASCEELFNAISFRDALGAAKVERLLQEPQDPNIWCHGHTPLNLAAESGAIQIVSLLLEARADLEAVSRSHYTPLVGAAALGHEDVVRLLLGMPSPVASA